MTAQTRLLEEFLETSPWCQWFMNENSMIGTLNWLSSSTSSHCIQDFFLFLIHLFSTLREITFFFIHTNVRLVFFSLYFQTLFANDFLHFLRIASNKIPNFPTDFQFSSLFWVFLLSFFIYWLTRLAYFWTTKKQSPTPHPTLILFYYFDLVWGTFSFPFFILTFSNFLSCVREK